MYATHDRLTHGGGVAARGMCNVRTQQDDGNQQTGAKRVGASIDADGKYETMAYKFEATPPFAVLAVSRPLPLQGAGHANFASGLSIPAGTGKVVVSYGASDVESRARAGAADQPGRRAAAVLRL